jgi:hypothetical protein
MIGYMSLDEQVEADFLRAQRRAFFGRIVARIRGECNRLLSFDEVRKAHPVRLTSFVWVGGSSRARR